MASASLEFDKLAALTPILARPQKTASPTDGVTPFREQLQAAQPHSATKTPDAHSAGSSVDSQQRRHEQPTSHAPITDAKPCAKPPTESSPTDEPVDDELTLSSSAAANDSNDPTDEADDSVAALLASADAARQATLPAAPVAVAADAVPVVAVSDVAAETPSTESSLVASTTAVAATPTLASAVEQLQVSAAATAVDVVAPDAAVSPNAPTEDVAALTPLAAIVPDAGSVVEAVVPDATALAESTAVTAAPASVADELSISDATTGDADELGHGRAARKTDKALAEHRRGAAKVVAKDDATLSTRANSKQTPPSPEPAASNTNATVVDPASERPTPAAGPRVKTEKNTDEATVTAPIADANSSVTASNASDPAAPASTVSDAAAVDRTRPAEPPAAVANPAVAPNADVAAPAAIRLPQHLIGGSRSAERNGRGVQLHEADQLRFLQRVAKAFQAAQERDGEIRLRLSPPELGSLRLEVKVQDGVMTARLETESSATRTLLIDNLPQLRERLADQGIRIEQFDIDLMNRQPGGNGTDGMPFGDDRQPPAPAATNRFERDQRDAPEADQVRPRPARATDGRLNVIV